MKKLISSIIATSLVLTLFSCNNSTKINEPHANLKTIQTKCDYGELFDNENIIDRSILIVKAKTLSQKLIHKKIIPFTHSTLKIEKVYKGDVKEGDTINILEFGGIVNGEWLLRESAIKFNNTITDEELKKARNEKYNFVVGGISISEINSTNIYFLDNSAEFKIQENEIPIGSYGIVGSNQGRYEVTADKIKRPKCKELKDSEMTIDELESKIIYNYDIEFSKKLRS